MFPQKTYKDSYFAKYFGNITEPVYIPCFNTSVIHMAVVQIRITMNRIHDEYTHMGLSQFPVSDLYITVVHVLLFPWVTDISL